MPKLYFSDSDSGRIYEEGKMINFVKFASKLLFCGVIGYFHSFNPVYAGVNLKQIEEWDVLDKQTNLESVYFRNSCARMVAGDEPVAIDLTSLMSRTSSEFEMGLVQGIVLHKLNYRAVIYLEKSNPLVLDFSTEEAVAKYFIKIVDEIDPIGPESYYTTCISDDHGLTRVMLANVKIGDQTIKNVIVLHHSHLIINTIR